MLKSVTRPQSTTDQTSPSSSLTRQRILVAVDYFDDTPEIFRKALAMAKSEGSALMVFHCLQGEIPVHYQDPSLYLGPYAGVYSVEMVEMEEKLIQEATERFQTWLNGFIEQAASEDVSAEIAYRSGDAGKEICQLAKEWKADLIIVGRSGKTGLSEFVLGSVSNYVVHHAPCSVLVVQH